VRKQHEERRRLASVRRDTLRVMRAIGTNEKVPPRPLCRRYWGMNGHNADIARRRG
jgi:hypothetical protein